MDIWYCPGIFGTALLPENLRFCPREGSLYSLCPPSRSSVPRPPFKPVLHEMQLGPERAAVRDSGAMWPEHGLSGAMARMGVIFGDSFATSATTLREYTAAAWWAHQWRDFRRSISGGPMTSADCLVLLLRTNFIILPLTTSPLRTVPSKLRICS